MPPFTSGCFVNAKWLVLICSRVWHAAPELELSPIVPLAKLFSRLFFAVDWSSLSQKPFLEISAPFVSSKETSYPWNRTQRTLHPGLVCTCLSDYPGFGHIRLQWSRIAVLWQQLRSKLLRGRLNGLPLWNALSLLSSFHKVTQKGLALGS